MGYIGCYVGIGSREVGQDWFGDAGVALISVLKRLGSVRVALEEGNGVGDDRV